MALNQLLLWSVILTVKVAVGDDYCITASTNDSHNASCLTLSQFAANFQSVCADNSTVRLYLQTGNHSLNVSLSISDVHFFSMESTTLNSLETTIDCVYSGRMTFESVTIVQVSNLTFKGCTSTEVVATKLFRLQDIVALGRDSSGVKRLGTALIVNGSKVDIVNAFFSGFTGSLWDLHRVKAQKYIKLNHTQVGGAIVSSHSNIMILESTFQDNTAQLGGSVFVQFKSNITILNCQFLSHNLSCELYHCYGGVIFSDYSSVSIRNCNFSSNTFYHSDSQGITRGGVFASFCGSAVIQESRFSDSLATFGGTLFLRYSNIHISNTMFSKNVAQSFGGVAYIKNCRVNVSNVEFVGNTALKSGGSIWTEKASLTVGNSSFIENSAGVGGTIKMSNGAKLTINTCNFTSNRASSTGAVIFARNSYVTIKNVCLFKKNTAQFGIISLYHSSGLVNGILSLENNSGSVVIVDSKFEVSSRSGPKYKAGRPGKIIIVHNKPYNHSSSGYHEIEEGGGITSILSKIELYGHVTIVNNSANNGGGILAVSSIIYINSQSSCTLSNNRAANTGGGIYLYQSILVLQGPLTLSNNTAQSDGGGLHSISSTLILRRYYSQGWGKNKPLIFRSNSAVRGGGACLEVNSKFYIIRKEVSIQFIQNTANYGGAIYVSDETNNGTCTSSQETITAASESECFFQSHLIYVLTDTHPYNLEKYILFSDNVANMSGGILFGGLLDRCTLSASSAFSNTTFIRFKYSSQPNFAKGIVNDTASSAVRVCFCRDYGTVDCSYQPSPIEVMKGEKFVMPLVAVDHVNHTVKEMIHSYLSDKESSLGNGQKLQNAGTLCSGLTFQVYSIHDHETLNLFAKGPCNDAGISRRQIAIKFLPCRCPAGFQPLETKPMVCECACDPQLLKYISVCDPLTNFVQRKGDFWIMSLPTNSSNYSYLIHPYCPFDYCQPPSISVNISLNIPSGADSQCAYNRTGVLCSSCRPGLSISLGSSQCVPCYSYWPALLLGITIGACIAGLAFVFVLLALNLTVAAGTLNGIIFYANILAANKTTILSSSKPSFVIVILSWLNLDIGFDTCYFDGMDTFTKSWIELVFPIYITLLVGIVILISKYSTWFSTLIGKRNPVSTLATLILLSYSKILQSTISAMSFAVLKYPNGTQEVVWRPDATVKYVRGKHFALFLAAFVILLFGIAYTVVLFSWQWLLQLSHIYIFKWVQNTKLTSFMDAYHAPYTPKRRYWTGLLLLARVILYLVPAINVSGEPSVNLLAIIVVVSSLFILKYNVYKVWLIDILETGLYVNLIIFSGGKLYLLHNGTSNTALSYVSTTVASVMLLFVIVYHLLIKLLIPIYKIFAKKHQFNNNDLSAPFLDDDSSPMTSSSHHGITCSLVDIVKQSQQ